MDDIPTLLRTQQQGNRRFATKTAEFHDGSPSIPCHTIERLRLNPMHMPLYLIHQLHVFFGDIGRNHRWRQNLCFPFIRIIWGFLGTIDVTMLYGSSRGLDNMLNVFKIRYYR